MIELPYFKFRPDEYITGDITMEDYDIQGIFVNVIAYYWKRNCNIPIGKLKKRYRDVTENQWETLIHSGIIKIDENQNVRIGFLDKQWEERQAGHAAKVLAGKKSAEKRWGTDNRPIAKNNRPIAESNNIDIDIDKEVESDKEKEKDKKVKSKPKEREIIFPFESKEFMTWWAHWKEYKSKDHRFKYKSEVSEQAALKELAKISSGVESVAIATIEHTIANGWKGFILPKNENKLTASSIQDGLEYFRKKKESGDYK